MGYKGQPETAGSKQKTDRLSRVASAGSSAMKGAMSSATDVLVPTTVPNSPFTDDQGELRLQRLLACLEEPNQDLGTQLPISTISGICMRMLILKFILT